MLRSVNGTTDNRSGSTRNVLILSPLTDEATSVKDPTKEADARIVIDDWLRQAKWNPADKAQVQTEFLIRIAPNQVAEAAPNEGMEPAFEMDAEGFWTGRADYV